tara:strand:+ start:25 stop:504 length:480 start_codon:yes stop_codon:yes gene_type:complete
MIKYICNIIAIFAGILIFLIFLSILYDVILRYFFYKPTRWALDIGELLLLPVVYLPIALTYIQDEHVKVDLLISLLKNNKIKNILDYITNIFMLIWSIISSFLIFSLGLEYYSSGRVSQIGEIVIFPYVFISFIGTLMFTIVLLQIITKVFFKKIISIK